MSDERWIACVNGGDLTAYGRLVERYQGLVFGVAFHQLANVEDARDVTQDVFIRAFIRIGQIRDPDRIGAWLRQVTINECRAWRRRKRDHLPLDEASLPGNAMSGTEERIWLEAALDAIDETSRLTVVLFYLHAYSLKEIGAFLDEPVTTIKSRLRNARGKLRKEMEDALERNLGTGPLPEDFATRVTRIIEAVKAGDSPAIRRLLEDDPRLVEGQEAQGMHGPLHLAASAGNAPIVELLLAFGADPNARDQGDNATPLHYAAERGWIESVKLLVEAGADVNAHEDLHERGPLGWSVVFGTIQHEVAEYLLARGARFDIFSAIALGREDAVRDLVAADPSVLTARMSEFEKRQTAIEFAASKRQFALAHLLVELGAKVSLSEAAALGLTDRLAPLLDASPDRAGVDKALWMAVRAGQLETARMLFNHGGDPNYAPQGTSLLFDAVGANDEAMARLLLEFGADLEFRDKQWDSNALGWQVFFGNPETTRLALRLGSQIAPHLIELTEAGERGELRSWSSGTPEGYRQTREALEQAVAREPV